MNITPQNYNHNASITSYAHPTIQNESTLHLQKQSNPKSASTSSGSFKGVDERKHILELSKRLPGLTNIFNLHHKIGEGSFSSVFLASLKYHDHLPREQRKLFAIKHLVPTSHPSRIEQELRCLKYIGGCDNVVGLDFCMRKYDTVIFVMPYLPHIKFSEYVLKMDVIETKLYVKNLLLALKRVHQFKIIHRDVKPSNFLYDRTSKRFLLVDFGLAQKMDSWPTSNIAKGNTGTNPSTIVSKNSLPLDSNVSTTLTVQNDNSRKRKYDEIKQGQIEMNELEPNPKRAQIVQTSQINIGECTPLKPLQEDHPKITPAVVDSIPNTQRSQAISPKIATIKRQVFTDDENRTKKETNSNMRLENVYNNLPINVQNYATNNLSSNCYSYPNSHLNYYYCNNSLQNSYNIANYSVGSNPRDMNNISNYYNTYYNNMLISNILMTDKNNINHYKSSVEYEYYKTQIMQSQSYYNHLYLVDSKLALLNTGVPKRTQKNANISNVATTAKVGNSQFNHLQLERGDISKQVSVKHEALKDGSRKTSSNIKLCACGDKPAVCSVCLGRGAYNAPRAGTQGFRPPEVLLKYTEQTTAVDLWACGVILLSILSGCYPFFRAPDDLTALAEMVTLFGSKPLKEVATELGRHLMCSHMKKPLDLRKLCSHLRYRALKTNNAGSSDLVKSTIDFMQDVGCQNSSIHKTDNLSSNNIVGNGCQSFNNSANTLSALQKYNRCNNLNPKKVPKNGRKSKKSCTGCSLPIDSCVCASEESHKNTCIDKASRMWCGFPDDAFDLLERLLDLNPHTRITATEALNHPFLADL